MVAVLVSLADGAVGVVVVVVVIAGTAAAVVGAGATLL